MRPPPDGGRGGTRTITSLQNERVKLIRSLHMRKARRDDRAVRRRGRLAAGDSPRCRLEAEDPGAPRRQRRQRRGARPGALGRGRWRGVPGGVAGRAGQAGRQGEPADHARRVRAGLEAPAAARRRRGGRALGGPGRRARPRQSRHHRPHGRCRRSKRRRPDRTLRRSLLVRGGPRHYGVDLQRAAGACRAAGLPAVGAALAGRHRRRASARQRRFPLGRLAPAHAPADGQRGAGAHSRAERGVHAARADSHGRPHQLAQPRGGHRADALRDAGGSACKEATLGLREFFCWTGGTGRLNIAPSSLVGRVPTCGSVAAHKRVAHRVR